jgi:hypothetical protein
LQFSSRKLSGAGQSRAIRSMASSIAIRSAYIAGTKKAMKGSPLPSEA